MTTSPYQYQVLDREVFRTYDIRGIVGEQLNEHAFYTLGQAISVQLQKLQRRTILLARDGRLSSETLTKALCQGLLDSGIDVVDLGAAATPVMYYATHESGIDSGLMVTGSHNPAEYNGIKMVLAGQTLVDRDITNLYDLVIAQQFISGSGHYETRDIMPQYLQRIFSDIKLYRPLKVVVDCGNGIAGPVIADFLQRIGCDVIPLYCEVDGRFPNHHPDPTVEANLRDVQQAIAQHQADIGLAFDGDADRLGVVTNLGEIIWPDRLMMFYAKAILKDQPGATLVYDVKCSRHLTEVIRTAGGMPIMCPTGHSIVKRIMKEKQAVLAGEMSGHIFFKDRWYGFDDALYSACRLLELLSQSSLSTSEQFATIPNSINTPEIKIPISENSKFLFMQQFSSKAQFPDAELITLDGLRVEFSHGWGLIRASNTTPCLVARFEAKDNESLKTIQALFKSQLQAIDQALMIPF